METHFESIEKAHNDLAREKLTQDLKTVMHDAEELLKATAGMTEEKVSEVRKKLAATLESARASCRDIEQKTIEAARATDRVIRDHPYESIGIAFAAGLFLGVLVTRK